MVAGKQEQLIFNGPLLNRGILSIEFRAISINCNP